MAKEWYISINAPFGGFAPGYWENIAPSFGNRNMARAMTNIDMSDPVGFKQGPGLANLTNGTQAGVLDTLLKHILPVASSDNVTFGIGGNKLHQISATELINAGSFPHTINKAVVTGEDGESLFIINGALYYTYNHSGLAGDIGKYDLSATFDDDWGSTVPTGAAALQDAPHPSVVGNDNVAYFGNGRYIGYYDPDTDTISVDDFDTPVGSECVDVRYLNSRVWGAFNTPNIDGNNNAYATIYVWGGVGFSSWDDYPNPRFQGKIGALYPFSARMFVWYQEVGYTGGYKLGYVSGNEIIQVKAYSGSLPNYAQVMESHGMLVWVSDGVLHRWGSIDRAIPTVHSQFADGGYATVGAIAAPFGTIMAASYDGSSAYRLAKHSGYDVNAIMKSLFFQTGPSIVNEVTIHFSPTASGARVDFTLKGDQLLKTLALTSQGQTGSITHANDAGQCRKTFQPQFTVDSELSIEASYAEGSAANTITIRQIEIRGQSLDKK